MGFGETLCDGIDLNFMEDGNSDEEAWIRYVNIFNTVVWGLSYLDRDRIVVGFITICTISDL